MLSFINHTVPTKTSWEDSGINRLMRSKSIYQWRPSRPIPTLSVVHVSRKSDNMVGRQN